MNPNLAPINEQSPVLTQAVAPLLAWYRQNARAMPWRDDPVPYHVWLSEVMLQQTRIEAARAYYTRFLQALPTIADLAAVEEEALLKLWEGLGYYSRARNLRKAAQIVMEQHGGTLPASPEELRNLPGIGEYTAGAVASIAFGIPAPAVDGNVLRVLARLLAFWDDVTRQDVKKQCAALLATAIPAEHPGDFNQALMELGEVVCIPNGVPLCAQCPLAQICRGLAQDCAADLPVRAPKKPPVPAQRTIVLLTAQKKILLFRREEKGLLAGLYEPLNLEGAREIDDLRQAVEALGGIVEQMEYLGAALHRFTHIEWHMEGYLVETQAFAPPPGAVWASAEELGQYALPSAFRAYTAGLPAILA